MKRLGSFSKGAGPVHRVEYLQDFKGELHEIDPCRKLNAKGFMLTDARLFVVTFDAFNVAQNRHCRTRRLLAIECAYFRPPSERVALQR